MKFTNKDGSTTDHRKMRRVLARTWKCSQRISKLVGVNDAARKLEALCRRDLRRVASRPSQYCVGPA
jgi:hypothetical protein